MLALILLTSWLWPADAPLARYDFLFLAALATQALLLATRLETPREALVIGLFHATGTAMELFKTGAGSWIYPEEALFRIAGVPLFSGFMYAAVGSYLARVRHEFRFAYTGYPPHWAATLMAILAYANFFTHHYTVDLRYPLIAATVLLWGRTTIHYTPRDLRLSMPLVLGFWLVALFIWLAENIGTFGGAWAYPDQLAAWRMVSPAKLGSWYLLMILSFVMVTWIDPPRAERP